MSDSNSPSVVRLPEAPPEARFEWSHSPFEAFLERNFKTVVTGVATAAVLATGWLLWRHQHQKSLLEQAEAFTSAETLDDYQKVINSFPRTQAAGNAQYMVANLLAQNNDHTGALKELDKFLAEYPKHPLVEQAELRRALLTIEAGETQKGLDQLEAFLAKYPQSPFRGLALLRKGDALYALGQKDKAIEVYTQMTEGGMLATTSGKPARDEAYQRLERAKLTPPTEVEFQPESAAPSDSPSAPVTPDTEIKAPALSLDAPEQQAESVSLEAPAEEAPASEAPAEAPATPTAAPEAPAPEAPAAPEGENTNP